MARGNGEMSPDDGDKKACLAQAEAVGIAGSVLSGGPQFILT